MIYDTLRRAIADIEKQVPCYPPCREMDAVQDVLKQMRLVAELLEAPPSLKDETNAPLVSFEGQGR